MKYFSILLSVFVAFTACKEHNTESTHPVAIPTEIEKVALSGLNGDSIDMRQFKGKAVFINFWATWCKPCIEEMPSIRAAMDSLKNEKIDFLFASDETTTQIGEFERSYHFRFNYVKGNNLEELGIMGLPTTLIFDKSGKKVFSEMGYRKWNEGANLDLLIKIINQK